MNIVENAFFEDCITSVASQYVCGDLSVGQGGGVLLLLVPVGVEHLLSFASQDWFSVQVIL